MILKKIFIMYKKFIKPRSALIKDQTRRFHVAKKGDKYKKRAETRNFFLFFEVMKTTNRHKKQAREPNTHIHTHTHTHTHTQKSVRLPGPLSQ